MILSSKLEQKFEDEFLKPLKIRYTKQYRLGIFVYDFYLQDYNTLIEIDGTFWHADPRVFKTLSPMQKKNKIRDEQKTKSAKHFGFRLERFWEGDVTFNKELIEKRLQDIIGEPAPNFDEF